MKKTHLLLLIILFIATLLRFYNLNWGNNHYFHPDENNMAYAITRLCLDGSNSDCSMNPKFFAYGQFPLYLGYFSAQTTMVVSDLVSKLPFTNLSADETVHQVGRVPFPLAIFFLRFWSGVFGVAAVFFGYRIGKELINKNIGLLVAAIITFIPGLIQSSHFGTTESALTSFFLLIVWLFLLFLKRGQKRYLVYTAIVWGIALGTKISALYFLPAIVASVLVANRAGTKSILQLLGISLIAVLFFGLTSPYHSIEFKDALGTSRYETGVAMGEPEVFYTRQFYNTTPVLFQLQSIFPYALGWPLYILGALGFLFVLTVRVISLRRRSTSQSFENKAYALLLIAFLGYFLPNAFLFAKWTRFITPIFPFFAIFSGVFIWKVYNYFGTRLAKQPVVLGNLFIALCSLFIIVPGLAFFSIYTRPDSRVAASEWIYKNIPDGSYVLSETANVVDIPLGCKPSAVSCKQFSVISFNFYELQDVPGRPLDLVDELVRADYIFVPSRRIFANHPRVPEKFPVATSYYKALFDGQLGFSKIVEINSYPGVGPISFPDEMAEETFTVFDHPVIRIYKKTKAKSAEEYAMILGI